MFWRCIFAKNVIFPSERRKVDYISSSERVLKCDFHRFWSFWAKMAQNRKIFRNIAMFWRCIFAKNVIFSSERRKVDYISGSEQVLKRDFHRFWSFWAKMAQNRKIFRNIAMFWSCIFAKIMIFPSERRKVDYISGSERVLKCDFHRFWSFLVKIAQNRKIFRNIAMFWRCIFAKNVIFSSERRKVDYISGSEQVLKRDFHRFWSFWAKMAQNRKIFRNIAMFWRCIFAKNVIFSSERRKVDYISGSEQVLKRDFHRFWSFLVKIAQNRNFFRNIRG